MRWLKKFLMSLVAVGFAGASRWPENCGLQSAGDSKSFPNRSTFLWSIRNSNFGPDSAESYLFGTIHVPYTEVWDYIDPEVKSAFQQADNVFFELDLSNPQTVSFRNNQNLCNT